MVEIDWSLIRLVRVELPGLISDVLCTTIHMYKLAIVAVPLYFSCMVQYVFDQSMT